MTNKLKELMKKITKSTKAGLLHFVCNDRMVAFCHASIPQAFRTSYKKVAFTLAEVLITLAIIGIVAAITIPTLNKKIRQDSSMNSLKKEYAVLNQGFKLMLANYNTSSFADTPLLPEQTCHIVNDGSSNNKGCEKVYSELKKYFKIAYAGPIPKNMKYRIYLFADHEGHVRYGANTAIATYAKDVIIFQDGSLFFNYRFNGDNSAGMIDVNGIKGPNKPADDIWAWQLKDGRFILKGEIVSPSVDAKYYCYNQCSYDGNCLCGGALIKNGWKKFW